MKKVFNNKEFYYLRKLKVKKLHNVFLTHYGICLKNFLTVKNTLPNVRFGRNKPNSGFFFSFLLKGLEIFLVCKYGKSLKSIELDKEKTYLLVYTPWFGYFSWVTESLPRILKVIKKHPNLTLIMPEGIYKRDFIKYSLTLFPDLKSEIIKNEKNMFIKNLLIPELKAFTYEFDPKEMMHLRSFILKGISKKNIKIKTYDKIYISRSKVKNRKIENNKKLNQFFELWLQDFKF